MKMEEEKMMKRMNMKWKITAEELSGFCAQMAMMLNSGMPIYEGLEILEQTHSESDNAGAYTELKNAYLENGTLYEAMKQEKSWPEYLVEMTGIGESTGSLDKVMNGLSEYYGREGRIRRAVINAVTYPVVLGIMMLMILVVMIVKVLPVFQRVLGNFGVEMSDSGNAVMRMGVGIGWAMFFVVGAVVLAVLVCCLLMKLGFRDQIVNVLKKAFPPMRNIMSRIASSRVASVLSMMISAGKQLDEALEMVPRVLEDEEAAVKIAEVRKMVDNEMAFEDALAKANLFDEFHTGLIRMSCKAGCVDATMAKVAAEYEGRVESGISNLISIIEPSLVAVLSIVIGAVLLSVMLPMAGIISSIL